MPARIPSRTNAATAVKRVQKTINVSAPTLDPGDSVTWTCNVFLLPFDGFLGGTHLSRLAHIQFTDTFQVLNPVTLPNTDGFGLLMAVKAWDLPGAERANPFSSSFSPSTAQYQFLNLMDAWAGEGAARIASLGYEIVDNTAELYRAGNMVSWRKSSMAADLPTLVYDTSDEDLRHAPQHRLYAGIPDSLASAFRIPGSLSTRFTEGTYVVATFNRHREDFELPSGYSSASMTPQIKLDGSVPGIYPGFRPSGSLDITRYMSYTHLDHSGSYCTGLNQQTTFTITLKAVLEILPNAQSVLIDFTQPSVPFNPRIEQLYDSIASSMPPATAVANNASGDFFKTLVNIATPLIKTMFPTMAPVIHNVSSAAQQGIQLLQNQRQAKLARAPIPTTVKSLTPAEKQMLAQLRAKKQANKKK